MLRGRCQWLPFNKGTIYQPAERAAEQRSNPVNIMGLPEIGCHRRAEDASRIHGRAGEWSSEQNIECNCRSDGQTGYASTSFIDGRAMNDKNKKERQNCFDQYPLARCEHNAQFWIAVQLWRAVYDHIAIKQA